MVRISKHISYKEATRSATALRLGIENIPNEYQLQNMEMVAKKVFEPLREAIDAPIKINSFFRCEELNKAIGGSSKSQHCQGRAIDIDDIYGNVSNAFMYYYIKDNLDFDQLIWEFGTDDSPDWVHVSYVDEDSNRKRCLKAYREDGKTKYIDITNVG
tara:strand:+ start:1083 stop:1556 length:474 start_codon:yes stop_codon:yes gene_type:complete